MSADLFLAVAWRAIGSYIVNVDTLATPADARAHMTPLVAPLVALAPPQWAYGATPDPLVALTAFVQGLPPPMKPEIVRELRSWALRVPGSPLYHDNNAEAGAWYTRTQRIVALADDPLPSVTSAATLALAQVLAIFKDSYLVGAARTFGAPPPQAMYQPPPILVYPDDPEDPMPPPIVPDPVPIDRSTEAGALSLAQMWTLLARRVQEMVDKVTQQLGI